MVSLWEVTQLTDTYINYKVLGQLYIYTIRTHTYYINIDGLCAHLDWSAIIKKDLTGLLTNVHTLTRTHIP